jgi:hypothetical protein
VDELSMLLDRFAGSQVDAVVLPPVSLIEGKARRRSVLRSAASVSVVVVVVAMLVFGLASVGLASESVQPSHTVAAASLVTR